MTLCYHQFMTAALSQFFKQRTAPIMSGLSLFLFFVTTSTASLNVCSASRAHCWNYKNINCHACKIRPSPLRHSSRCLSWRWSSW
ncbi:hypothetical protein K402DRAFT_252614 [Aulographum hederae CBS 113979]|uniref:Uncharacterized protein n=1 Tax=Aulographum hederae CBS 113979 TaxID=1176131 RepID=A0A6G1GJY7_9PEZI|nr:hypothetical protein K402DRAFT_252614 [Aulographum hederae CBS 113979]